MKAQLVNQDRLCLLGRLYERWIDCSSGCPKQSQAFFCIPKFSLFLAVESKVESKLMFFFLVLDFDWLKGPQTKHLQDWNIWTTYKRWKIKFFSGITTKITLRSNKQKPTWNNQPEAPHPPPAPLSTGETEAGRPELISWWQMIMMNRLFSGSIWGQWIWKLLADLQVVTGL